VDEPLPLRLRLLRIERRHRGGLHRGPGRRGLDHDEPRDGAGEREHEAA
jgi:hypothetical protein